MVIVTTAEVHGHGMLLEPPSRASAWRLGGDFSKFPHDYDDNACFCGGFAVRFYFYCCTVSFIPSCKHKNKNINNLSVWQLQSKYNK